MLRTALFNTTRHAARPTLLARQAARPTYQIFARYESSKANDALKAARKAKDKLQKDWQGPVLTYEQVKPRTLSPSADAYLIDVREPDEVMQGSIPSSVNLPLSCHKVLRLCHQQRFVRLLNELRRVILLQFILQKNKKCADY
ncbi:hypothetical protein EV424DRAFT_199742 [Suillus variegatus]|nr:hypothetical protein EV424DRAFT_199742 [Suillus variegatus]